MKIFVLTGAGLSAESGLNTFRGADGLWEGHRVEDVASPEGFQRNPGLVYHFYNLRRRQLYDVKPNEAHFQLARLQKELGTSSCHLVTQNVDDLLERAIANKVIHMHGELRKVRCVQGHIHHHVDDLDDTTPCPTCQSIMRPHIVWFGEMPLFLDEIYNALESCTHFVHIGTSGLVYPAAGFINTAKQTGSKIYYINREASDACDIADKVYLGNASIEVKKFVDDVLNNKLD